MLTFTLVLFALAGLFLASPAKNAFKFVYMDKSGIHYSADAPRYLNITRRDQNGDWGKPMPKPKPKGHQGGWHKQHDHKPIEYHGHYYNYDPVLQIIIEAEAEGFCSTFLNIVPYAATTTEFSTMTTSLIEATDIITSTSILNPGSTTVTATATTTTTTSDVVATFTETDVITSTSTSTTTSTTTTFQFTAPNGLERREGEGCEIPGWLPYPSSRVSSACDRIVTRKTEILSATSTSTVPLTTTTTTTTTTTLPQITDTVTSSTTSTEVIPVTDSTTTFTTTATTTTTTAIAVATQCAQFANVDGGGLYTGGGTLSAYTNIQSAEECCEFCYTTTSCGLWFFFPGYACFIGTDASGPNPSTQCPTGEGDYLVINALAYDGNLGGAGPCAGALI